MAQFKIKTAANLQLIKQFINEQQTAFKDFTPIYTEGDFDLQGFGKIALGNPMIYNAYFDSLVNKSVAIIYKEKLYEGHFAAFHRADPSGNMADILEKRVIQMTDVQKYDPDKAFDINTLFGEFKPDIMTAFFKANVDIVYPITRPSAQNAAQAFNSFSELNDFVSDIINAVLSTINIDDENLVKYLVCRAILDGKVKVVTVTEDPKVLAKAVKNVSKNFGWVSPNYNITGYNRAVCAKENQVFMVDSETSSELDVDLYSQLFNLDKAEIDMRVIDVDNFTNMLEDRLAIILGTEFTALTTAEKTALAKVKGLLSDEMFVNVYDLLMINDTQHNAYSQNDTDFYHKKANYLVDPFTDAVVFATAVPTVTSVTITPAAATVAKGQGYQLGATVVTADFAPKSLLWSSVGTGVTVDRNGYVSVTGLATVGETATITATSVFDPTKTDTCVITII